MANSNILFKPGRRPAFPPARERALLLFSGLWILGLYLASCSATPSGEDNFLHPPTKAPTPTLLPPQEFDLSAQLDAQGRTQTGLAIEAPDGCMRVEIDPGATILQAGGQPATRLVIQQDYPGKLPMEAYGVAASYAYRFGPDELRLSAPAKIIFSCLKNFKKTLVTETSLGMKGDNGQWEQLSVQGDENQVWTRLENLEPGWSYFLVGPAPMGS